MITKVNGSALADVLARLTEEELKIIKPLVFEVMEHDSPSLAWEAAMLKLRDKLIEIRPDLNEPGYEFRRIPSPISMILE